MTNARTTSRTPGHTTRGAFTLIELMIVLLIIGLLVTIVAVALGGAFRTAKASLEKQTLRSLALGVDRFREEFGFLPPVIDDTRVVSPTTGQPVIVSDARLASTAAGLRKYSVYSLPFYLVGAADDLVPGTNLSMDGVSGPGLTRVEPDGSFRRAGRAYEAFFEVKDDADRVVRDPSDVNPNDGARVVLVDFWGQREASRNFPPERAIRYYRWLPTYGPSGNLVSVNAPAVVRAAVSPGPDLNAATFAIVSAGPDGLIDDVNPDADVNKDNLVEVGR